jgi:hypothetical protein
MHGKLHLVRDVNHERERAATGAEDRYRHPAHDEMWEISCEEWKEDDKPALTTLTTGRRRAS